MVSFECVPNGIRLRVITPTIKASLGFRGPANLREGWFIQLKEIFCCWITLISHLHLEALGCGVDIKIYSQSITHLLNEQMTKVFVEQTRAQVW